MPMAVGALLLAAAALQAATGAPAPGRAADEAALVQKELRVHLGPSAGARDEAAEVHANLRGKFELLSMSNIGQVIKFVGSVGGGVEKLAKRTNSSYQRMLAKGEKLSAEKFQDLVKRFLQDEAALLPPLVNSTAARLHELRTALPFADSLTDGLAQPLLDQASTGLGSLVESLRRAGEAPTGEGLCAALEPVTGQLGAAGALLAEKVAPTLNRSSRALMEGLTNPGRVNMLTKLTAKVGSMLSLVQKEAFYMESALSGLMQGKLNCGGTASPAAGPPSQDQPSEVRRPEARAQPLQTEQEPTNSRAHATPEAPASAAGVDPEEPLKSREAIHEQPQPKVEERPELQGGETTKGVAVLEHLHTQVVPQEAVKAQAPVDEQPKPSGEEGKELEPAGLQGVERTEGFEAEFHAGGLGGGEKAKPEEPKAQEPVHEEPRPRAEERPEPASPEGGATAEGATVPEESLQTQAPSAPGPPEGAAAAGPGPAQSGTARTAGTARCLAAAALSLLSAAAAA